ncbi:ACSF2 [Branchiostoma lanceolatum]|uniref:ACSF2 protein n=1 Tax=Branchiostoma lanceolatum TaxID=7740 RepID=A0A8K0EQA6_BRALA|nr:ACSF2 [Branchiostoma lanceolatum]
MEACVKVLIMGDDAGTNPTDDGKTAFLFTLFPEIKTADPGKLKIDGIPTLTSIVVLEDMATRSGAYTMEEVQRLGSDEARLDDVRGLQDQLSCHDIFMLGFTSGSTGQPKCVELSTYAVHNNIRFIGKAIGLPKEGMALYPYLAFHYAVIYPFTAGCTLVVPASMSPTAVEIMQIIQEERCKAIGVLYLKDCHGLFHDPHFGEYDLSSLDRVTMMKIVGKDCQVVPLGHEGEVCVRAYSLFNRYRGDEEKTSKAMTTDRWYKTGDIGVQDEEGVLKLVGRISGHEGIPRSLPRKAIEAWNMKLGAGEDKQMLERGDEGSDQPPASTTLLHTACYLGKCEERRSGAAGQSSPPTGSMGDVIIRNSFNMHPTIVELPLSKHPKVQDVRVVGVPDPASVEEICACVILKKGQTADSQEMMKFCAEIEMVPREKPGYFLFMDEFPMTLTRRKVDRKKLRLIAMEKLGLKELV